MKDLSDISPEYLASKEWVFLGHGLLGTSALRALIRKNARPSLVLTAQDAGMGAPVADLARRNQIPMQQIDSVASWINDMSSSDNTDFAICCGWGEQLKADALAWPRDGWLNLHPGALPGWRGADPVGWQLLFRSMRLSFAIHKMLPGFDTGPVVGSGSIARDQNWNRWDGLDAVGEALGIALSKLLLSTQSLKDMPDSPQEFSESATCPPLGVIPTLVPGKLRTQEFITLLMALSPHPGAAIYGLDFKLRASQPALLEDLADYSTPGSIKTNDSSTEASVCCLNGWVTIHLRCSTF